MKTIYIQYIESPEAQGVFDDKLNLLDVWSCNDADFRHEYFTPFLRQLDIAVETPTTKQEKVMQKKIEEYIEENW